MPRKSRVQLDAESALRCLNEIHLLAQDDRATYRRNAADCARWVRAVQAAKMPLPVFMVDGNIKFFAAMWGFPHAA